MNDFTGIQEILDMNKEIMEGRMQVHSDGNSAIPATKGLLQQLFPTDSNPSDHVAVWTKITLEL